MKPPYLLIHMLFSLKTLYAAGITLACTLFSLPVLAHDPFDGSIQVLILDERIEARVTLGYDAARAMLRALDTPSDEASAVARSGASSDLPPERAAVLLRLYDGQREMVPTALLAVGGRDEVSFVASFSRPAASRVSAHASYFALVDSMRPGTLVVTDSHRRVVLSTLLSKSTPVAAIPLDASAASPVKHEAAGFGAFFRLGVEHILTGFDHLLFLCALLVTLTKSREMVAIVTAFTLAHSVTLALAVLDLVVLPASVVEPLIALSIIVACVVNLVRQEAAPERLWMAAAFGLIHGFGFAGMLREAMLAHAGQGLLVPLLAFNLGVEAGQLAVAAALIGVLLLLRDMKGFARYVGPSVSSLVIATSTWWLLERLALV